MSKLEAIKVLLKFVFELQKGVSVSLEDGMFEISDVINFKNAFLQVPYVSVALPFLKGGFKDITVAELEIIKEYVVKEFDLKNDKTEEIIEESIGVAISIFSLVEKFSS